MQQQKWRLAALALLTGCMSLSIAHAAESVVADGVDGNTGVLQVRGALTESACRLDMRSAFQDVYLGEVGTGRLSNIGERATPVKFQLQLRDCLRGSSRNVDERTGTLLWSANQPSMTISFTAPADIHNPQLVRVNGASGIGLRLTDPANHDVALGMRGQPVMLTPGQNQLTYAVALERTPAALRAGAFWSQINFKLNYD